MDRLELISSLKELSQLSKKRKAYEAQIEQLKLQRDKASKNKGKVQVQELFAENAVKLLGRARTQAEKSVIAIQVCVWIVALLGIVACGVNLVLFLLQNPPEQKEIFILVPVTACIAAFCFYKIATGYMECLGKTICWVFGVTCTLEFLVFSVMTVMAVRLPAIIFFAGLAIGVLIIVLVTLLDGWKDRICSKHVEKMKASQEYKAAEEEDRAARRQNEQRKKNAIASRNQAVQRELDTIDSQIRALNQQHNTVDSALRNSTIYPYKDLYMIDRVIDKLEGMRANTLQEALLQCDEDNKDEREVLRAKLRREDEAWERRRQQWQ